MEMFQKNQISTHVVCVIHTYMLRRANLNFVTTETGIRGFRAQLKFAHCEILILARILTSTTPRLH